MDGLQAADRLQGLGIAGEVCGSLNLLHGPEKLRQGQEGLPQVLPDVLGELEPTWQEFEASGQSDFAAFVEPRSEQIAGSIMNIADNKSQQVNNGAFLKAYNALRGKAVKIVTPHVPALARTLAAHM